MSRFRFALLAERMAHFKSTLLADRVVRFEYFLFATRLLNCDLYGRAHTVLCISENFAASLFHAFDHAFCGYGRNLFVG